MSRFCVGSVPYANGIPLFAAFRLAAHSDVDVRFDVPSRLPALLDSGQADAILVSSLDALRVPDRRLAVGVCVGSDGPVESVRLFSKTPPEAIRSLALDASSLTSNRLAQIILQERYGVRPTTLELPPVQADMLEQCDACVLIGDIGMTASSDSLHVLDLGEEWTAMTGLPFVWAAWIGNERLTPVLAHRLVSGGQEMLSKRPEELVGYAKTLLDWPESLIHHYFFDVMHYAMDQRMLAGLSEFGVRLRAAGFDDCRHTPILVQ